MAVGSDGSPLKASNLRKSLGGSSTIRSNSITKTNARDAKESVVKLQEHGHLKVEEVQAYKQFASEFDKINKYNSFANARLTKDQFCKILIDLAVVQSAKLSL